MNGSDDDVSEDEMVGQQETGSGSGSSSSSSSGSSSEADDKTDSESSSSEEEVKSPVKKRRTQKTRKTKGKGKSKGPSQAEIEARNERILAEKKEHLKIEGQRLIKQLMETIRAKYGAEMKMGTTPKEAVCLQKYGNFFVKTISSQLTYFENFFNKNLKNLLNLHGSDRFLRRDNLIIKYELSREKVFDCPEDREDALRKIEPCRIYLSNIYNMAYDLCRAAEEKQSKQLELDETFIAKDPNLIRPDIIKLHLSRICFYIATDETHKEKLARIVTHFEEILEMPVRTAANYRKPSQPGQEEGMLKRLTRTLNNAIVERGGSSIPFLEKFDETQAGDLVENLVKAEGTQKVINGLMDALSGKGNIEQVAGTLLSTFAGEETKNNLMNQFKNSDLMSAFTAGTGSPESTNSAVPLAQPEEVDF